MTSLPVWQKPATSSSPVLRSGGHWPDKISFPTSSSRPFSSHSVNRASSIGTDSFINTAPISGLSHPAVLSHTAHAQMTLSTVQSMVYYGFRLETALLEVNADKRIGGINITMLSSLLSQAQNKLHTVHGESISQTLMDEPATWRLKNRGETGKLVLRKKYLVSRQLTWRSICNTVQ